MKKIIVVTTFAAAILAAHSAAACDWSRETRVSDPAVATTAPSTTNKQASQGTAPQSTSVTSDESSRTPVDEPAPVVLITNRH